MYAPATRAPGCRRLIQGSTAIFSGFGGHHLVETFAEQRLSRGQQLVGIIGPDVQIASRFVDFKKQIGNGVQGGLKLATDFAQGISGVLLFGQIGGYAQQTDNFSGAVAHGHFDRKNDQFLTPRKKDGFFNLA